jgi:hypothetical protein
VNQSLIGQVGECAENLLIPASAQQNSSDQRIERIAMMRVNAG